MSEVEDFFASLEMESGVLPGFLTQYEQATISNRAFQTTKEMKNTEDKNCSLHTIETCSTTVTTLTHVGDKFGVNEETHEFTSQHNSIPSPVGQTPENQPKPYMPTFPESEQASESTTSMDVSASTCSSTCAKKRKKQSQHTSKSKKRSTYTCSTHVEQADEDSPNVGTSASSSTITPTTAIQQGKSIVKKISSSATYLELEPTGKSNREIIMLVYKSKRNKGGPTINDKTIFLRKLKIQANVSENQVSYVSLKGFLSKDYLLQNHNNNKTYLWVKFEGTNTIFFVYCQTGKGNQKLYNLLSFDRNNQLNGYKNVNLNRYSSYYVDPECDFVE